VEHGRQVINISGQWMWNDDEGEPTTISGNGALFYTHSNYKTWLKTNVVDLFSDAGKTKLSVANYLQFTHDLLTAKNGFHNQNIGILNLDTAALIFDHFTNGNLIIYGNTDYYIDDISNPNILNAEASPTEVNYML
jgi:hypothetical protein